MNSVGEVVFATLVLPGWLFFMWRTARWVRFATDFGGGLRIPHRIFPCSSDFLFGRMATKAPIVLGLGINPRDCRLRSCGPCNVALGEEKQNPRLSRRALMIDTREG